MKDPVPVEGNPHGDRAKAISPDKLRNTTAPRKVRDQPEDRGSEKRDVDKDYDGAARKDH